VTNHLILTLLLVSAASPSMPQERPAPAGPQPVSRAVYMQRVDSVFAAVDTNKDGFTDRAEIEAVETKAIAARRANIIKQREATFRRLDKNGNGSLSLQEFNAEASAQQMPKANATPRLTRLDTNKDGKVSAAESRAPATSRFNQLDTNKDNILSVQEQQAGRRR
jgi:Ca2+-binding EF-hand superfamily protein